MSSAYHPQSDGQTERVNQCLETFLRCFVHACPHKWSLWLAVAEFWYNMCTHSALGASPFEVLYGHRPRHFGISDASAVTMTDLKSWVQERELMQRLIKQHLLRAQDRMKKQADKKRSERVFAVNDWVFLKLQPYVQSSVSTRANHKLSFKFFGPFQIVERISPVAYRLQLPAHSSIHPVFHVSQLKPVITRDQVSVSALPTSTDQLQIPVRVLQRRMIQRGGSMVAQVKVLWSGMDTNLASWEDATALRKQFPGAPAWGQAGPEEAADVSSPDTNEEDDGSAGKEKAPTIRRRQPNRRVIGPEWAK